MRFSCDSCLAYTDSTVGALEPFSSRPSTSLHRDGEGSADDWERRVASQEGHQERDRPLGDSVLQRTPLEAAGKEDHGRPEARYARVLDVVASQGRTNNDVLVDCSKKGGQMAAAAAA